MKLSGFLAVVVPFAICLMLPVATQAAGPQSFDSKGVKIAYAVEGKGEPVILIHGWLSSGLLNWDLVGVTGHLARSFQVIRVDMPGHGLSDKPLKEEAYGLELVEHVVRLMDHLKISKAHVVGYSMGGIITAKLTARYPDRVRSAMICGMGWLKKEVGLVGFEGLARDARDAHGICFKSLGKLWLTEDEIKGIRVPVAILVGDNDGLIKKLYVEPAQAARKDWPVIEVKGGDHITTILKPQFKEEIYKWLEKQLNKGS